MKVMSDYISHIDEPVVAIAINRTYRDGISTKDLYDRTRGTWKISPSRAEKAHYAFAVYQGVIQEVYEIFEWMPSDSEEMVKVFGRPNGDDGRWGFRGSVAPNNIRAK